MLIMWLRRNGACSTFKWNVIIIKTAFVTQLTLSETIDNIRKWNHNKYTLTAHQLLFLFGIWSRIDLLTDCAQRGKYHVDPTNRCVSNTPFSTLRSITSIPTTAGFIGFGYFLHAACATVSHGWLKEKELKLCYLLLASNNVHIESIWIFIDFFMDARVHNFLFTLVNWLRFIWVDWRHWILKQLIII